jgi:hypothetical protein
MFGLFFYEEQLCVDSKIIVQNQTLRLTREGSIDEIYRFSSRSARLINSVCTHSLIYGSQHKRRIVDDHMVKHVNQGELA